LAVTRRFGGQTEVIVESRIPEIIAVAEAETQRATQQAANNIVHIAKDRSRVETGAMKAGWQSRRAPGNKTYEVLNPVTYTVYNEYGTINMGAQPMLAPAVEETRETFKNDIREIWEGLALGRAVTPSTRFSAAAEARRSGSTFG